MKLGTNLEKKLGHVYGLPKKLVSLEFIDLFTANSNEELERQLVAAKWVHDPLQELDLWTPPPDRKGVG